MRKYLYGISSFVLAFVILSVSILRCSIAPAYGFYSSPTPPVFPKPTPVPEISYDLPYPGKILPDNWLWYIKVIRDKTEYLFNTNALKKANLALLYSDKRLEASRQLLEKNKPDLAISVLTKGEKYLETAHRDEAIARRAGLDTKDFLVKLTNSSLKHRQIIEEKILPLTPEDLKPDVVKIEDYAKNTYKVDREELTSNGISVLKDPFNGQ